MARTDANEKEFKAVSYLRLLKYLKPYRLRLAIGIIAGLVVGGSLFGSLMIVPKMMMIVDQDSPDKVKAAQKAEKIVTQIESSKDITLEEKKKLVTEILHPTDDDPKLTQAMDQLRKYAGDFHLPVQVNKQSVDVTWPIQFNFPVVDEVGRITWQFFAIYAIGFVFLWALKSAATYINHYFLRWVGAKVVFDLRNLIYSKLVRQSMTFHGKQDIGHLMSRCTQDTAAMEDSISNTVADIVRCPMEILACIVAIIITSSQVQNPTVLALLFIGLPVCILPIIILAKRIRRIYKKSLANIAEITSRMHETFTGILVVKACDTENQEIGRFEKTNKKYFKTVIRATRLQLLMSPMMEFVAVTAALVFLVYAYGKGVTISQMVVILAPAILAYRPIKDLAKIVNHLQRSMAAADRFFDIIDTNTELPEDPNPVQLKEFKNSIAFKDVTFSYDSEHKVLDSLSLEIPRGQMIAVVGETGSGKTTIANLIARFYDVTAGEVDIDGVDIRRYSTKTLREHIGVVTQNPILFNDTIANNIAYGCPEATREQIIEAAKQANAHEFITSGAHPLGYDDEVGEKGLRLSGGEKQRVAIARAILKNPPILILDEATSALDTVTEKLVQDALNRVMTNRTVFAIAHRLSTIRSADKIIVLASGRIVESGNHDELMALNGRYRHLYDTQFSGM